MRIAPATRGLTRLAWRELRWRPGRTLLVIAIVAFAVAALVVASVLSASAAPSARDQRVSKLGGADVRVQFVDDHAAGGDPVAEVLRRLPAGSRVVRVRERAGLVPARGAAAFVEVDDLPLADSITAGMTKLLRGRAPTNGGEVAGTRVALHDLGLHVGDMLVSRSLGLRARITGELLSPIDLSRSQVHSGAPLSDASSRTARLLVDLPAGAPASAVQRLRGPGRVVTTVADCCPGSRTQARAVTLTISGLALFIVALVVAAAFAVGARRQLRVIGLLGAAAGADQRHVRRLAVLQGTFCGGAGVIAGFAVGLAVVQIWVVPNIDDLAGRLTGGVTLATAELVSIAVMAIVATAAGAWLPGRTAARIPILAALGGRAPLRPVRARVPVRGLAISAFGTVLLAAGLGADGPYGVSVAGAVMIVLGFVLCPPAIIAVLERLANGARGTTRLALREIARQRARTGPLVAAILAVVSLAVLGSTLIRAIDAFQGAGGAIRADEVQLSAARPSSPDGAAATVPAQLRAQVRALLPGAAEAQIGFHERRSADGQQPGDAAVQRPGGDIGYHGVAIGGPRLLEFLGAGAGRAALHRCEVVALTGDVVQDGQVRITIPQARGPAREVRVPARQVHVDGAIASVVVPAQMADSLGLTPTATDILFRTPAAVTAQQHRALQALAIADDRSGPPPAGATILHAGGGLRDGLNRGLYNALLAIAAALALAVVASGLALSAAEGKPDDTLLVALGADPANRRRLRATQAGLLVGIGGLLAVPAGLIPATVIVLQTGEMRFAVPWTAILIALVALPAAAAAGAWLLTRPARWSDRTTWAD